MDACGPASSHRQPSKINSPKRMLAVPQAVTDNRVKLSGHRQSTETDSKKQLLAVPQAVADN